MHTGDMRILFVYVTDTKMCFLTAWYIYIHNSLNKYRERNSVFQCLYFSSCAASAISYTYAVCIICMFSARNLFKICLLCVSQFVYNVRNDKWIFCVYFSSHSVSETVMLLL